MFLINPSNPDLTIGVSKMSTKRDVRLLLSTEKIFLGPDSAVIRAIFHVAEMTDHGIDYPAYPYHPSDPVFPAYDGLVITGQANTDDKGRDFYGWSVEYRNVFSVNLARAQSMVSLLRKVERHLEKLAKVYGSPTTFAEYVGRVADALGANRETPIGIKVSAKDDYNGTGYRWATVDGLRYHLDDITSGRTEV